MESTSQVRILEEAVCISCQANASPLSMGKIIGQIGLYNFGMTIDLEGKFWIQTICILLNN